jgi:hypothetical protein
VTVSIDYTTLAIEAQTAERDRLRGEVDRLSRALVDAHTSVEVLTAERDRLRALVEEACGELEDTGGELAARRAAEIEAELELLRGGSS